MEAILKTPDNKRVKVNTTSDLCLYDSPHNPPNTGTRYTRGTDLYFHKSRSGGRFFYFYYWSMWQGEESNLELISEGEAKDFIIEKAGLIDFGISIGDPKILSVWTDIFNENA